jgi:tetrapyrrole methylase family protein/MazG family protein
LKITIVGLGPGRLEQLTLQAWQLLEKASEVYLRTSRHPLVKDLPCPCQSFDSLYDKAESFDTLYQDIAEQIIALGQRPEGVIYAVPGHPYVGEQTTPLIQKLANEQGIPLEIIEGLSFIEPTLTALGIDGITGLQIHDAIDIAAMHHPPLNPDQPALIAQVYNQATASHLKLTLMNQYPDEHPAQLIHGAGTAEVRVEDLKLYEIDRSPHIAHLTTLYIPPMEERSSFAALQEIMAHLRAPEGCPWDQKQTHQSLRPYFLEETYEVLETLDNDDPYALVEELGDVLLHIVFHSQIGVDENEFYMHDVIRKIIAKMIRRHPHIWGDVQVSSARHVEINWEAIKLQEQAEKKKNGQEARKSHLDGIPQGLPALVQAFRIQEKAAGVGFDWKDIAPVIDKVREEIAEIQDADTQKHSHEFGDLLFAVVNWARWAKIDPESALREANNRFRRRFAYIEQIATEQGHTLKQMTLEQMDALWDEAKAHGL